MGDKRKTTLLCFLNSESNEQIYSLLQIQLKKLKSLCFCVPFPYGGNNICMRKNSGKGGVTPKAGHPLVFLPLELVHKFEPPAACQLQAKGSCPGTGSRGGFCSKASTPVACDSRYLSDSPTLGAVVYPVT